MTGVQTCALPICFPVTISPIGAIEESDPIYIIDPDICTECVGHYDEPACISVCPVECIMPDPDNIESVEELKLKFEQLNSDN